MHILFSINIFELLRSAMFFFSTTGQNYKYTLKMYYLIDIDFMTSLYMHQFIMKYSADTRIAKT